MSSQSGVVAVEFVLVLPLILFFLFAITDFGRVLNYVNDANQLAADGARMAAVNTYPGSDALRLKADTAEARTGSDQLPGGLGVCVEFPEGSANVGDPVRVEVTGTFGLMPVLDLVLGDSLDVPIHGEATMRIERSASFAADC